MRATLLLLPLSLCAAPALAQQPARVQVPPALTDPAIPDKLARAVQAISNAFLDLRVGEIQAAVDGRAASAAEKRMTVRDAARSGDPDFDRKFARQMAQAGPMIQQSLKALGQALPAVMKSLDQAGQSFERAAANMPDPTYPKR